MFNKRTTPIEGIQINLYYFNQINITNIRQKMLLHLVGKSLYTINFCEE